MRGRLAFGAQILSRFDNTSSEKDFPETIDCYPGSQRVVFRHEPLRKPQTIGHDIVGERIQHELPDCTIAERTLREYVQQRKSELD